MWKCRFRWHTNEIDVTEGYSIWYMADTKYVRIRVSSGHDQLSWHHSKLGIQGLMDSEAVLSGLQAERNDSQKRPYAQSRILYEINYLGMESSAHDVVIMSGQYGNTASRLPVPDSDGLIIRSWDDPRVLVMKLPGDNNFDVILTTQLISEVFSVTFKHFLYCDTLLRIDMTCDDRKYLKLTWTVRM